MSNVKHGHKLSLLSTIENRHDGKKKYFTEREGGMVEFINRGHYSSTRVPQKFSNFPAQHGGRTMGAELNTEFQYTSWINPTFLSDQPFLPSSTPLRLKALLRYLYVP